MNHTHAMSLASERLKELNDTRFDLLSISRPKSESYLRYLGKIISKLSPIIGNLIEFNAVEYLNTIQDFWGHGQWERQDPGFPDAVFKGNISPMPGIEIKAWFPFATEMTARFRESQTLFPNDETAVAILAWVPEYVLWGRPKIIGLCIVSALSMAKARDEHYNNPPIYLVFEPEKTSHRTANLQQTNTNGFRLQERDENLINQAKQLVESWGKNTTAIVPIRIFRHVNTSYCRVSLTGWIRILPR
ncbi:MAG: hypothetical protein IJJ33_15885 [Victivallales bacterium]|nr:hypothetical protein [Victivallales bacterium]